MDLRTGAPPNSQQVFTGECCTPVQSQWLKLPNPKASEGPRHGPEQAGPGELLNLTQLGIPSRTGPHTEKKLLVVGSKSSGEGKRRSREVGSIFSKAAPHK